MKRINELSRHITGSIINDVYFAVSHAKNRFKDQLGWAEHEGGYFCVADGETGIPHTIALIGNIPIEKSKKYFEFCQEKALRLAANPAHASSWESRDPNNNKWGGAVRLDNLIFSFSGFPEMGDEVIMLAVAASWRHFSARAMNALGEIAIRSSNPYWLSWGARINKLA